MTFRSPYLRLIRLHQPTGIWLLLWPCWWGLMLGAPGHAQPLLFLWFALGALIMRSAGCIVNDMADREFDKHVERTKTRPLASGELSLRQAGNFLLLLLVAGLAVLWQLPHHIFWLGIPALGLMSAYPFMKRFTWWPQAFLGLTFNWGALMGWAAGAGEFSYSALWLYFGGFFWTLGYDTIYGHQDKADDVRIGVKSTSLYLGARTRHWVAGFYGAMVACFALAIWSSVTPASLALWIGLALISLHLAWQIRAVNTDHPASCMEVFRENGKLGWLWLLPWLGSLLTF